MSKCQKIRMVINRIFFLIDHCSKTISFWIDICIRQAGLRHEEHQSQEASLDFFAHLLNSFRNANHMWNSKAKKYNAKTIYYIKYPQQQKILSTLNQNTLPCLFTTYLQNVSMLIAKQKTQQQHTHTKPRTKELSSLLHITCSLSEDFF